MQERRQHHRIAPKGAVTLRSGDDVHNGRLANISKSGVFIAMRDGDLERFDAHDVSLEIRLDTAAGGWLTARGRVSRVASNGVAVAFDHAQPALDLMIEDATGQSNASTRVLTVVLIDRVAERRRLMTEGFRAIGCNVIAVGSSLEAIVRLGELGFEPNVIAIADSVDATAMHEFTKSRHSSAQVITIGDELLEPEGIDYWLSSSNPGDDLAYRVRDVLLRWRLPVA